MCGQQGQTWTSIGCYRPWKTTFCPGFQHLSFETNCMHATRVPSCGWTNYYRKSQSVKKEIDWFRIGNKQKYWVFSYLRKSPGESSVDVIPAPRPSLRDMHSPQPHAKSTIEEDMKRHSAPDSPPPPRRHKEKVHLLAFHLKINPVKSLINSICH